jgi:drug/metabolite transporter (DMT)-like permease
MVGRSACLAEIAQASQMRLRRAAFHAQGFPALSGDERVSQQEPDRTGRISVTVAAMLVASALVAGTTLLAKALGTGALGPALHPFQITAGRFVFALVLLIGAAGIIRPKIIAPAIHLHAARAVSGWLGVTAMFTAATLIPLADATAISFLNPMFAMLIAIPLLGERVGPIRWTAASVSLAGALLLIRPGSAGFHPAALIALLAAVMTGFEVTIVKILSRKEGSFQILLFSNSLGTILALGAAYFVWLWPTPQQWAALIAIGFLMMLVQAVFLFALRRGDTSFVIPFFYATLIFAALYDFALFEVIPSLPSLIGGGVIILGAILLAWSEHRRRSMTGDSATDAQK